MEITDVDAWVCDISIDVPLLEAPVSTRYVYTEVKTDVGITGHGLTGYLYELSTTEFINKEISPLIVGEDPLETGRLWNLMQQELNPREQTGPWSTAVSAVDIALWDIKGKFLDEPVWRLLGGAKRNVKTYVTFGLADYSEEELVQMAERLTSEGHTRLKMVVGSSESDPINDARRVEAVRNSVGEGVRIMIDANYGYSIQDALDLCNRVEQYNISWFEEPIYGNDADLLADLRNRTRIPIAAGQNEGNLYRHKLLMEKGSIDISQPNVVFLGGYTEAKKVASLAQAYNLDIANGGAFPYQNMHFQGGMTNGTLVEFHYLVWKTCEKIYRDPPKPDGDQITLPNKPGLGLEPNSKVIDESKVG